MKQPNTNMVYTAALYLRLSKDDGIMDKDSASIDTQRDLLTRYCNDNNIIIYPLEPVHIKIASKIIAKVRFPKYRTSSLS